MKKATEEKRSTRRRILNATVNLLYVAAPSELTTRRIAREARVNVAAVNYHYGSKDALVDEAVHAATAAAFDLGMRALATPDKPAARRLREFFQGYATGLVRVPGITRTAWSGLILREDSDTVYGRYMRELLEKTAQLIVEITGGTEEEGRTAALQVFSCVVFPFLVAASVKDSGGPDYGDDAARTRYIDTALARLVDAPPATKKEYHNG
jgi:AcrR family transcriptional regulator